MDFTRDQSGQWIVKNTDTQNVPEYIEAVTRYLNIFHPIFLAACEKSEFYFLSTLLGIKGVQDAGWDPFETTVRALKTVAEVHRSIKGEAQRHIELWLYGHITEASEPYELVANLLGIAMGEPYMAERFPHLPTKGGKTREQTHGEKTNEIQRLSKAANLPDASIPIREMRDRELRNSIFHSDYALYGPEVRIRQPIRNYTHEQITVISNRALAYIETISSLKKLFLTSYSTPKIITTPSEFGSGSTVVLVAEGEGAVGLQAALSHKEIQQGHILWRMALLTPVQKKALEDDPTDWTLPGSEIK